MAKAILNEKDVVEGDIANLRKTKAGRVQKRSDDRTLPLVE